MRKYIRIRKNICRIMFLSMIFLISCSTNSKYVPDELKEFEVENIKDTITGTPLIKGMFIEPMGIETIENYLIVIENTKCDGIFSVYDIKEDSIVARFGQIGHAKNEFLWAPTTCYFGKKNGNILMYVPEMEKRVKVVNLTKSIKSGKCVVNQLINHGENTERYYKIDKKLNVTSKFVTYNDPRDHIFFPPKFILKDNNRIRSMSFYPSIIECQNFDLLTTVYNSEMRISPQKNKIVEGLLFLSIINILDVEKIKTIGVVEKNTNSLDNIEKHQKDMRWLNKHIIVSTRSMCVTNHYIMVLQDRRCMAEVSDEKDEVNSNRTMLIFNQDGDYLKSICLADEIDNISFYELDKLLFGIDQNGTVLSYDLNKYL
jgi:hypothetical protein